MGGPEDTRPGDEVPPSAEPAADNICPDCGGSGSVGDSRCETCGGTGTVTEAVGGG